MFNGREVGYAEFVRKRVRRLRYLVGGGIKGYFESADDIQRPMADEFWEIIYWRPVFLRL